MDSGLLRQELVSILEADYAIGGVMFRMGGGTQGPTTAQSAKPPTGLAAFKDREPLVSKALSELDSVVSSSRQDLKAVTGMFKKARFTTQMPAEVTAAMDGIEELVDLMNVLVSTVKGSFQ